MEQKTFGIDLGHCKTTISYPFRAHINEDKYTNSRLNLSDKETIINTEIWLSNLQMQLLKGHQSPDYKLLSSLGKLCATGSGQDGEAFGYFKVAPKNFGKLCGNSAAAKANGITHGMVMSCFAYFIVESIFQFNNDKLSANDRKEVVLLIGCPATADWTSDAARKAYAEQIQLATGAHEVRIAPESRAAMFSSVESDNNAVSTRDGAIVFDFGSSTADCTYMLLGRKLLEFSWTLGASSVEHQIAMSAFLDAVKDNDPNDIEMTSVADNERQLRTAKEAYYEGKLGQNGRPMYCTFVKSSDRSTIDISIRVDSKLMQKVTAEDELQIRCDSTTMKSGGWQSLCRDFYGEAKKRVDNATYFANGQDGKLLTKKCTVNTIVLTGGASRMDFILPLCQEVFPDVHIFVEKNPSYTVSNGLGWVAVLESRLDDCIEAAKKKVMDDPKCNVETLKTKASDLVFDYICSIGMQKANEWADATEDKTMQDLQNMIDSYLKMPQSQKDIELMCETSIGEWKRDLSNAMADAVNAQIKVLFSEQAARGLIIPPDIWSSLQANGITIGNIPVEGILGSIDMSSIARKISNAILWAIALLLAWATWGGSLILVLFTNDDKEMKKPRNHKMRKKAVGKISDQLQQSKDEITKSIKEVFSKFEGEYSVMLDVTLLKAFEIVTLKRFEL